MKEYNVIILDTETTGIRPSDGHRVIDIACVEVLELVITGKTYQSYLNPLRKVDEESFKIHGLSNEFLQDKPVFKDTAAKFLEFINGKTLAIHNAKFDIGFLNNELLLAGLPPIQNKVIDTVEIAKTMFPGSPVSLDALCRRFKIDLEERAKHGALVDSILLAKVYIELMGGRQSNLELKNNNISQNINITNSQAQNNPVKTFSNLKITHPNEEELNLHKKILESFQ